MRTDVNGAVYETCTSWIYGDVLSCNGGDPSPLHFTGKQRDPETNLDEFPARYYSSTQGRWLSPDWSVTPDPVPYAKLGDPQTLNLYAYVGGDPTNHADPDGHFLPSPLGGLSPNWWEPPTGDESLANSSEENAVLSAQLNTPAASGGSDSSPAQNTVPLGQAPAPPPPPPGALQKTEYPSAVSAGAAKEQEVNPQSRKEGLEYGGNIYKNPDGTYSTQAPNKGGPDSVQLPSTDTLPPGTTRAGWYHTHGNGEGQLQGGEIFSDQDKGIAGAKARYDHNPHEPAVLGTPSGKIKVYDPATGRTTTLPEGTN